jgi:CheY-like chemotaxis protein
MRLNGGQLTLTLDNVRLTSPKEFMALRIPSGHYLKLSIEDTGTGMVPAVVERIFDPYFTTKAINEGTGLGLAVTLGIIRNYEGLIEVDSLPGRGSRFDIYLPLSRKTMVDMVPPVRGMPRGKGEHILIVDDEPFCLDVVREHISRLGYRVTTCKNGLEARDMIRENPGRFDLLITDQTMPGMTGVQLAEEMMREGSSLPIILCTGYSDTITESTMADHGIRTLIMKPVTGQDLAWAIYRLLGEPGVPDEDEKDRT